MTTIPQLPRAESVSASDLVPVSQAGSTHAVSVGNLLANTQPAIMVEPPCLLGRVSIGAGGPDLITVGSGLVLSGGTIALDAASGGGFEVSGAPQINSLAGTDLVAVSQGGNNRAITLANLLDGVTIDLAPAATAPSDSDTFWVAQSSNNMVRQTLGALSPWLLTKYSAWKPFVIEVAQNVTLDGVLHNRAVIVCSAPVQISIASGTLPSGFSCDIINVSGSAVLFGAGITCPSGAAGLAPNQFASVRAIVYSGGAVVFAFVNAGGGAGGVPSAASNLAIASATSGGISLTWSAPSSGTAPFNYSVESRLSGAAAWSVVTQGLSTASCSVTGLQPGTSYDFAIVAANAAGVGPLSTTVTGSTQAAGAVPSAPTGLTVQSVTASSITCSWTAPSAGGTVSAYQVQYRTTGQTTWQVASGNVATTSYSIGGLTSATSYDIEVLASNVAGMGPPSGVVTASTSQSSGLVTNIAWNVPPTGTFAHGSGSVGMNAHVTPAAAPVQFGFSSSATVRPASWTTAVNVNTDLWGAFVPVPSTPGSFFGWAEGTDGSFPVVYPTPITVT